MATRRPLVIISGRTKELPSGDTMDMSLIEGLSSALGNKLNTSSYTASDVLAKLLTTDTVAGGLDSAKLNGQNASYYLSFANTTNKPTTLAGYGITDAASSTHTHTFASLTSKPTTISGYGITDAVTTSGDQTIAGVKTWSGNQIFNGNVTINGTTTTLNSTTLEIEDAVVVVAKGNSASSVPFAGLKVERGSSDAFFVWDESIDAFVAYTSSNDLTAKAEAPVRASTFTSTVATGTAPFTVTSTTQVNNLNAALLNGQAGSYYLSFANTTNKPTTLAGYGITDAQASDATLTALAGVTTAADTLIYATGVDTFSTTALTSFGRSLIDDTSASAARTTLGVAIGTDVQAYDATLQALAALNSTAGLVEQTGADTFTKRAIGSSAATDVLDRQSADARYRLQSGSLAIGDITNLQASLDAKASLASPVLTGVPTAPTAAPGTNTTQVATTAYVQGAVAEATGAASTITLPASEALSQGQFVHIWNDAGTAKVRKANAASGLEADGYVAAAVTSGGNASVYLSGVNSWCSGLTIGDVYLSGATAGAATSTPTSSSGHTVQCIGKAITSTTMIFIRNQGYELA